MTDRSILYVAAFLRAFATGLIGVLLGLYLARRGFAPGEIGLVVGCGLVGAALSAYITTFFGDRFGRKRSLILLTLAAAAGGAALCFSGHVASACVAAFLGMVNGMGRDRGAALVLEQAILPGTGGDQERTRMFAWYNVLQDSGHALGGLAAALPAIVQSILVVSELVAYQSAIALYAAVVLISVVAYLGLSPAVEVHLESRSGPLRRITSESRGIVRRISGLFAIDSIAGGFLGTALLSYFFFERFDVGVTPIALLFFFARVANAVSHLGAAWLARRIGLVNTMVFTHIPSSVILIGVAFASEFWIAATLFVIRELLVEMDVPTRQSYVMAVVRPDERTWASGITSLVRMGGWAVAPFVAGFLMQGVALATPLLVGAAMKIGYDLLLWKAFRNLKPPEELNSIG